MDPARTNPLYETLSYVHPVLAALSLLLALVVLNAGLTMQDARRKRRPRPDVARRHLALAPWAAWGVGLAFVLGPLSSTFLRGFQPMRSAHGWLGLVTTALFVAAALLGRRLKVQPGKGVSLHGKLGLLAMALSMAVALTGFALLP